MAKKELSEAAVELSRRVSKAAKAHHRKLLARFTTAKEREVLGDTYFLGAASAKVLHSTESKGYINVVQYLAPADRGTTAFLTVFPEYKQEVLRTGRIAALEQALSAAKRVEPIWADFAGNSPDVGRKQTQLLEGIQLAPKDQLDYTLPDYQNKFLSLCPFASPDCRGVCLNTAGQGGMERTGSLAVTAGAARQAGYTHTSDLSYLFLRGFKAFYGGESNSVIAARVRRTHVMLLAWMREGILDNSYNQMLEYEAEAFIRGAKQLGLPMALRLNGTSDFPAHTLLSGGRNLMEKMHAADVVCYDYTKHYRKMQLWMDARAFSPQAKPSVTRGFPVNYHLVFSWSEKNAKQSLKVLQGGGNVVMVFRRSLKAVGEVVLPKQAGRKGTLPTHIAVGQLSQNAEDRDWLAEVVNGDEHDLRFLDPNHVGKKNGGIVVGLVAKGQAVKAYTGADRRDAWKHFTSPVMLKRIQDQVRAEVVENPGDLGAVQEVDSGLLKHATVKISGFDVVPTNLAT